MNWIEVKAVFPEVPEDWAIYVELFDQHGCPGTLQEDSPPSLSAYLADLPGAGARVEALTKSLLEHGVSAVTTKEVPEENWADTWKQFFKTRRVGERIVISPSWERYAAKRGEIVIVLDPGQAFGTGDHPTTRLCLALMEKAGLKGKSVADVGCGSGILAIAACKLGARTVAASDIDEASVEVARANAELNGVSFSAVCAAGFDAIRDQYEVVLSNIISATLIRLSPEAAKWTVPGGAWIVSGIIAQNWEDVRLAAESAGFRLQDSEQEDEWIGAVFRR